LQPRLVPAPAPDDARLGELVRQLDDPAEDVRERAMCDLVQAGAAIERQVREALQASPSAEARARLNQVLDDIAPRDGEFASQSKWRREARLVTMLQEIATPAAVEQLITMSAGPADSPTTRAARAALRAI
jgi:hypothetical protein